MYHKIINLIRTQVFDNCFSYIRKVTGRLLGTDTGEKEEKLESKLKKSALPLF